MAAEDSQLSGICDLPDSFLQQVFSCLEPRYLLSCEAVCRRWLRLIRVPEMWRDIEVRCKDGELYFDRDHYGDCASFMKHHGQYIRTLNLHEERSIYGEDYFLNNCYDLHKLNLLTWDLREKLIEFVTRHKNLREFQIIGQICYYYDGDYPFVPFDAFPFLHTLHMQGNELQCEENRDSLLRCRLRELRFITTEYMGEYYLEKLIASQQETLTRFWINVGWGFSEGSVQQLALCSQLESFYIGECPDSDLEIHFRNIRPNFHVEVYSEHNGQANLRVTWDRQGLHLGTNSAKKRFCSFPLF